MRKAKEILYIWLILFVLFVIAIYLTYFIKWKCPSGMVYVPSGKFLMRWTGERYNNLTEENKYINHYCIDIYEYPNIKGEYPLPAIWTGSVKLCHKEGKRLCTQFEWQKACQGALS